MKRFSQNRESPAQSVSNQSYRGKRKSRKAMSGEKTAKFVRFNVKYQTKTTGVEYPLRRTNSTKESKEQICSLKATIEV